MYHDYHILKKKIMLLVISALASYFIIISFICIIKFRHLNNKLIINSV